MTGQIILTKPLRRQPVTTIPVEARSVKPVDNAIVRLILFVITLLWPLVTAVKTVVDQWPPRLPAATRQQIATLSFLATIVLMVVAENYLDRALGVVA